MAAVHVTLTARPKTGVKNINVLTVALVGIRRMYVILGISTDVRAESNRVQWTLSPYATLDAPLDPLVPDTNIVNLAPSQVTLPPLGAARMLVACLFWPQEPALASMSVLFSTDGNIPQGKASAWGIGDTTPHNYFGMFTAPFGHARDPGRIVDPLPTDPKVLQQLEIEGRIPPQLERRRLF